MSLLVTKPSNAPAGSPQSLGLDLTALSALVSGDAYFSDSSNWKRVVFYYFDATDTQKIAVIFNTAEGYDASYFSVSNKARKNLWQLKKVVFEDFDGGSFVCLRDSFGSDDDILVI